ncbi:MAG: NUDIX hydrolase [Deltaproteobacteria bacterium]|jgi:8-oxo-dGTP pyrophosphatase MutT (NUDIX family)|nr:NUDIX hydrolase [Deltaproteobacteria bacterium]
MAKLKPWNVTGQSTALSTPVFEVLSRRCLSPKDGREKTFTCLTAPEWVNVIPLTADGRVLLVNQFRHGSSEFSLELPGGVSEAGQTVLETARRELMEETGYSAELFEPLCSLRPNPALFDNRIHTFVARPAEKTGQTSFDENEDLDAVLVPLPELRAMLLDGRIDHALMVAAIGLFLAREGLGA